MHRKLTQRQLAALTTVLAILPNSLLAEPVQLRTAWLPETIGQAHQLTVEGELTGRGKVRFDPNVCQLNAFGDPEVCTEIASNVVYVTFERATSSDPTGRDRRLYRILGDQIPRGLKLWLVVPGSPSGPHRLLVEAGRQRRAITLEPVPAAQPAADLCRSADYSAVQQNGKVTITATGQHPTAGWQTKLDQLPQRIYPPEFQLLCQAPVGPAAQVITAFETSVEFTASGTVRRVTVVDAGGRHRIPVRQKE